jgi:sugar-specific transcriptional regulator TrmB
MLTDTAAIRTYFAKLGLDKEIADIYLALHANGPQTISELSRSARVERTRIYRLIDKLLASNLIEVESHYKRGIIKAAPIANLHILIGQKEQELKSLQDELGLIEQVLARNSLSSPATRVQFYHGREGIRQMLWNELNAKSEIVGYNYRILEEGTGKKFMERWTEEFERRKLKCRLITSDDFAESWDEGLGASGEGTGDRVEGITYHCISPAAFKITHSCDVYDNVVGYYQWKDNDVFGIELYNQEIADTQRDFFETIWAKSKPETRF